MVDWRVVFEQVTILALIVSFTLIGLVFRRASRFGTSLSLLTFTLVVAFFGVILRPVVPLLATLEWRLFIRAAILLVCLVFLNQARLYYGGVRGALIEAGLGFVEIVSDLTGFVRTLWCIVRCGRQGVPCRHVCRQR